MSDKRTISEVSGLDFDHEDKKHLKAGRKPIDTEPKSKRTAQNRAAQRAYRERKERKMKDLEDKVKSLEDENVRAVTQADFLEAQIDMLKKELSRYRGHLDFSDLNLPLKVGHLSHPRGHQSSKSPEDHASTDSSTSSEVKLSSNFPWSRDNRNDLSSSSLNSKNNYGNQVPDLIASGSLSSTSPLNENILVSPDSQFSVENPSSIDTNNYDFANKFDEQVDSFCVQLSEACGTKDCPVPLSKRKNGAESIKFDKDYNSPFSSLVNSYTPNSDPFFNSSGNSYDLTLGGNPDASNDPLFFLNDNNFDVSLAFGQSEAKQDPLDQLTTEESAYDVLNPINTDFNFNEFIKSSVPKDESSTTTNSIIDHKSSVSSHSSYDELSVPEKTPVTGEKEDDEDEVVPAPEKTLKCSEIWDRITSHPKYTDIDIDGLCSELKSKAKCSDGGVVLNSSDVKQLLASSVANK